MNEIDVLTRQTLIKCQVCEQPVPLNESVWSVNMSGHPEYKCRTCHDEIVKQDYEKQAIITQKDRHKFQEASILRDAVTSAMRQKINVPHISELAEETIRQLGGLEGFVRFWVAQGIASSALKPGSKHTLDFCRDISKLIEKSTQHRETAPDVAELDDAAILAELRQVAHNLIQSKLLEDGTNAKPKPVIAEEEDDG